MVQRKFDNDIEEAMQLGRENAQKQDYLNWCRHLQINLLYASQVGEMTGLPIGPHEIHCPYFHGSQGVSVETIATHFIQQNCFACQYHDEVNPDNRGKVLIERVRQRKSQPDPYVVLRQELRKIAQVDDPGRVLQQNVSSDKELYELITLFDEPTHKMQAASKVLAAAKDLSPQLFSPEAVRVLTTYLSDKDMGDMVVEILRGVCAKNIAHFDSALESVKLAYKEGSHREALAYFMGDYVQLNSSISAISELIPSLVTQQTLSMDAIFSHRPSEGAVYALRAVVQVDKDVLVNLLKGYLNFGEKPGRLAACDVVNCLVDANPEFGKDLFEPLLRSLNAEEDSYGRSADRETVSVISRILITAPKDYIPRLESFYNGTTRNIRPIILKTYRELLDEHGSIEFHGCAIQRATAELVSATEDINILAAHADYLEAAARQCPELLVEKTESLLGIISLAAERSAQKTRKNY